MNPEQTAELEIANCWKKNAQAWRQAIAGDQISSRIAVTNAAIIEAAIAEAPGRLLDLGCGEGWLCRALIARKPTQAALSNLEIVGVDASAELLEIARGLSPAAEISYLQADYQALLAAFENQARFETIVCNFSLLGEASVSAVFAAVPQLLSQTGRLIVQTLHPENSHAADSTVAPADGWQAGSWEGFSDAFRDPAPWYYRQRSSWQRLFAEAGLSLQELNPCNHEKRPVSALFIGKFSV